MAVKITQRQAVQIRAMIRSKDAGELFDKEQHLATSDGLSVEGIGKAPISYSIYKSVNSMAPYVQTTEKAEPVEGYVDVELNESAFFSPDDVESKNLDYNFAFVPENRTTFAFQEVGHYFVDVTIFPKTGAAIVFRTSVEVC